MKIILLIILNILSITCWGQASQPGQEPKYYELSEKDNELNIHRKSEIHLYDDMLLTDRSNKTNAIKGKHYTKKDYAILSTRAYANEKLHQSNELFGVEVAYAMHFYDYWFEAIASRSQAHFSAITENRTLGMNQHNAEAETNFNRPTGAAQELLSFALGVGHRSRMHVDVLDTERIFHSVHAYLVYHQLEEGFRNERYSGPGLRADYGVYFRASRIFSFGLKFSYNLGFVKREGVEKERNTEQRLRLSYNTLLFDIGCHF